MSSGIQLVILRCPDCGGNLRGEKEGVFLYCGGCGSGYEFNEKEELQKIPVYFARMDPQAKIFFPFWAFDAQLTLQERETKRGIKEFFAGQKKGLVSLFEERGVIRFYCPAFQGDLETDRPRSLQLTYQQPELEFIERRSGIDGFVISRKDAEKIADYLFLTSEIEQPDMVRNLRYQLHLTNPMVIVIAFPQS